MWHLIVKNKSILIFYIFILIATIIFLLVEGKINSFVWVNKFHNPFYNGFFKIVTNLGNGFFMVLIGLGLILFMSFRHGMLILSSFLSSAVIVQALKRLVFTAHDRPVLFFEKLEIEIYKIPGLEYFHHFSFPSGHSTTAFALFTGLALFSKSNILKFLFIILACITAFSRVYLSQHFLEDIIAGSALGTITALVMHFLYFKWDKNWLDKSLLKLIHRENDKP